MGDTGNTQGHIGIIGPCWCLAACPTLRPFAFPPSSALPQLPHFPCSFVSQFTGVREAFMHDPIASMSLSLHH